MGEPAQGAAWKAADRPEEPALRGSRQQTVGTEEDFETPENMNSGKTRQNKTKPRNCPIILLA